MKLPIIKNFKKPDNWALISAGVLFGLFLLVTGVAIAIKSVADWGAGHKFVEQRVVDLSVRLPFRIEKIEPVKELVVLNTPYNELTTTEQKIIQIWKDYKTSMIAIAIFDCGESGLNPDSVSLTGDLGVAQINWYYNGKIIQERLGYNWADMRDIDKNLKAAYLIWDRGDGTEGNGEGSWNAWSGFNNSRYLNCFK